MSFHRHICGCYYNYQHYKRMYLPQVKLESHTTITPVSFTTELTQTFRNPNDEPIESLRYCFPLYDGVAVNGYTISYDNKTLVGVVKQKDQARQTYQAAVDRGETAGLLESLPAGVFGVTLGNVPPNADIVVELTYAGELRHDASIDGLRYMLPTSIAPRYGDYPGDVLHSNAVSSGGISITVDIDMGKSAIRRVQSPSHPIALSMGELSTAQKDSNEPPPFSPSQASATLTQGTTELAGDFILQLLIDDISKPQAILEVHPTLPAQRAIMATMVPKFTLESANPEIVFIADQSGSMSGTKNAALVKALKVFLKSLPMGVRFNICPFGSRYEFLWPTSQAYSEANVNKALSFVEGLTAKYGGTEIFQPIQEIFKRHLKDMPLQVMLLTDGEIWGEQQVFNFINEQIRHKGVDARVFALGIGQDVSHTLIEGVARAGNGFAQFVTQNEDTDQKVIRMLKGALYAHTKDYQLEVHYADEEKMDDDDFEIVEKVNDCLVIKDQPPTKEPPKPKSLFDTSVDLDKPVNDRTDRYAHLPTIAIPKVLQAPADIPPMFPFNRTTVYLLLGPDSVQKDVKSITLRATSEQGPLELNIPTQGAVPGTSIHQLAARKAIQDLEEGRGWLQSARVQAAGGETVAAKKKYESRFDEIVEREGARLGEMFQVASKWTSFVAVEDHGDEKMQSTQEEKAEQPEPDYRRRGSRNMRARRAPANGQSTHLFGMSQAQLQQQQRMQQQQAQGSSLFGASSPNQQLQDHQMQLMILEQQNKKRMLMSRDRDIGPAPPTPSGGSRFAAAQSAMQQQSMLGGGLFGSGYGAPPPPAARSMRAAVYSPASAGPAAAGASTFCTEEECEEEEDEDMGYSLFDDGPAKPAEVSVAQADLEKYQREMQDAACMPLSGGVDPGLEGETISSPKKKKVMGIMAARKAAPSSNDTMHSLIDMQKFSGYWTRSEKLFELLGVNLDGLDMKDEFQKDWDVAVTAVVVAYFEKKLSDKRDVWEMVVQKARAWLQGKYGGKAENVDPMVAEGAKYLDDDGW